MKKKGRIKITIGGEEFKTKTDVTKPTLRMKKLCSKGGLTGKLTFLSEEESAKIFNKFNPRESEEMFEFRKENYKSTLTKETMKKTKDENEGFIIIPTFRNYGINPKTKQIKNFKSGNIVVPRSSNNKYQLTIGSGIRKEKTYVDLLSTLPAEKLEKVKTKKVATKEAKKSVTSSPANVDEVVKMEVPQCKKIYYLNELGLDHQEIHEVLSCRLDVIARDLRDYKSGKKKI